jgi:threonine/homoserine/homoserine lactone efflux protein
MHPIELLGLSLALVSMAALPGLSVLMVTSDTLVRGFRSGVYTAAGIVIGDVIWLLLAFSGLVTVYPLLDNHWFIVRFIAALVLIYLAMGLLWQRQNKSAQSALSANRNDWQGFIAGLMLTLADFKAILFYVAILPAFVEVSSLALIDMFILLIITIGSVAVSKLAYVVAAARLGENLAFTSLNKLRFLFALMLLVIAVWLLIQA